MSNDLQAKFERAKALVKSKQYAEARAILEGISHPKAKQWLTELAKREVAAKPVKAARDIKHTLVWVWGAMMLGACSWISIGYLVSRANLERVTSSEALASAGSEMAQMGGALGAVAGFGSTITFLLCTGIPVFLLGLALFIVTTGRIRRDQQHAELLAATGK